MMWLQHPVFPFGIMGMAWAGSGFAGWLALLLAWQVLVFSFLRYEVLGFLDGRYYLWFAPSLLLYAGGLFGRMWQSRAWRLGGAAVLLLTLQHWFVAYANISPSAQHPSRLPIRDWPEIRYLRESVPPDAWIAGNIPAQIAWYAGRGSFHVTNRLADMPRLLERWPADYLFLSNTRVAEIDNYPEWKAFLRAPPQQRDRWARALGFAPDKVFEAGVLYVRGGELDSRKRAAKGRGARL